MTRGSCASGEELLAYWLGELDATAESRFDEHLLGCSVCSERLRALVDLGVAIRGELVAGTFDVVVPVSFVHKMKDAGLRVREYDLGPGASVSCTVTRDDDLVVAYLRAPLRGVRRLDLVIEAPSVGTLHVSDVAFDAEAGSLAMLVNVPQLRTLGHARQRVRLLAVDDGAERVIADYTFNHYPS